MRRSDSVEFLKVGEVDRHLARFGTIWTRRGCRERRPTTVRFRAGRGKAASSWSGSTARRRLAAEATPQAVPRRIASSTVRTDQPSSAACPCHPSSTPVRRPRGAPAWPAESSPVCRRCCTPRTAEAGAACRSPATDSPSAGRPSSSVELEVLDERENAAASSNGVKIGAVQVYDRACSTALDVVEVRTFTGTVASPRAAAHATAAPPRSAGGTVVRRDDQDRLRQPRPADRGGEARPASASSKSTVAGTGPDDLLLGTSTKNELLFFLDRLAVG